MKNNLKVHMFFICMLFSLSVEAKLPIYVGEILGRDLNIPGLGWLGHVGISYGQIDTGDKPKEEVGAVIEVLNNKPVIQVNRINSFKHQSNYWGSRYGISSMENPFPIADAARTQRAYCPEYTKTALWRKGRWNKQRKRVCAKFRCDTFVNYSFHEAGYTLPTYNGTTLPRLVFNAFPKSNEDVGRKNKDLSTYHYLLSDEQNIESTDVYTLNNLDFSDFESLVMRSLRKASILWEVSLQPGLTVEKSSYLIDIVSETGGPQFLDKMMSRYETVGISELKTSLLAAIQTIRQSDSKIISHKQLETFYKKHAFIATNTVDKEYLIRGLLEESQSILVKEGDGYPYSSVEANAIRYAKEKMGSTI